MVMVPNNESFSSSATSGIMTGTLSTFKTQMDRLLIDGRTITLDLSPSKTPCTSSSCKYNQTYNQYVGINNRLCRSCSGKGFVLTPRQTQYKCNRRWTNRPFLDAPEAPVRLLDNYVRVKTHIASYDHLLEAESATLDGQKVYLVQQPRKSGWNNSNLYVISWWSRKNNSENG